jgi:hypothetical protein
MNAAAKNIVLTCDIVWQRSSLLKTDVSPSEQTLSRIDRREIQAALCIQSLR